MIATSLVIGVSQHALAARQLGAAHAKSAAQCASDALEARLDHVVRVLASDLDVDRGPEA
jgi:hypothetical protein